MAGGLPLTDSHQNLFSTTVQVAPSPATSGTTFTMAPGDGYALSLSNILISNGSGQANLTFSPANTTATLKNSEIATMSGLIQFTIAAGSNGAVLPQSTINFTLSTASLPTAGSFTVNTLGAVIAYTGKSGNTLTGCTVVSGGGTLATNQNCIFDNVTITRAQEGTTARTVLVGDVVTLSATSKTFTDIEQLLPAARIQANADVAAGTVAIPSTASHVQPGVLTDIAPVAMTSTSAVIGTAIEYMSPGVFLVASIASTGASGESIRVATINPTTKKVDLGTEQTGWLSLTTTGVSIARLNSTKALLIGELDGSSIRVAVVTISGQGTTATVTSPSFTTYNDGGSGNGVYSTQVAVADENTFVILHEHDSSGAFAQITQLQVIKINGTTQTANSTQLSTTNIANAADSPIGVAMLTPTYGIAAWANSGAGSSACRTFTLATDGTPSWSSAQTALSGSYFANGGVVAVDQTHALIVGRDQTSGVNGTVATCTGSSCTLGSKVNGDIGVLFNQPKATGQLRKYFGNYYFLVVKTAMIAAIRVDPGNYAVTMAGIYTYTNPGGTINTFQSSICPADSHNLLMGFSVGAAAKLGIIELKTPTSLAPVAFTNGGYGTTVWSGLYYRGSAYTQGQLYYSDLTGALTTTESPFKIGYAITADLLWLIPPERSTQDNIASLFPPFYANSPFKGYVRATATYTANFDDRVITADTTGGAFTITLPLARNSAGATISIVKIDAAGNTVTVQGNGSENINGANTSTVLSAQYNKATFTCNGAEWFITG